MELITVPTPVALLTDGSTPGGRFALAHSECALSRGLERQERVLLLDPDGEFHSATVVEVSFASDGTCYLLRLGARLPPEMARAPLAGEPEPNPGTAAVIDLLAELRDHPERR